jgi:putative ABC transport system permease protein
MTMKIGAEIKESFGMAINALIAHKLRSSLTLLGVLVGVFSIIVVMTAMRALQRVMETELSQLGANTFVVQKWPAVPVFGPESWEKYWRRQNMRYPLFQDLKDKATLASSIAAQSYLWTGEASSKHEKTNPNINLIGITPEVFEARNWNVELGRALLPSDLDSARYVCVLGNKLAKTLFPFGPAVAEKIKFHGVNYEVVGVLASKGASVDSDQDNFIAVPLTTGMNRYGRDRSLELLVTAINQASYDDTVEQVRGILRTLRKVEPGKEDDFDIVSNDSLIRQFQSLTLAVRLGVSVISSIALVAAGIGIMNIMLVSVTERTREIGIRRAIGAKKRNILTQFIMEAISLCEVGGVLGILLGLLGGNLAAYFLKVPMVVPYDWVLFGLVICSVVGITFGTYPAYKAANIDPIDALRYE